MNALVVYDSTYGNTARLAGAIGVTLEAAGAVEVRPIGEVTALPAGLDLLVVGGPTHAHGVDATLKAFLDRLTAEQLQGLAVAVFDTRFRMPVVITGSAARGIAKRLQRKGGHLVAEPESFFVEHGEGPLVDGEIERAESWARQFAAALVHVA